MESDVFRGPLSEMPDASRGSLIWPSAPAPRPPRFVTGFELFARFARDTGEDPAVLAEDLAALWAFLAEHPPILSAPEMATSAARFLGNTITTAHPGATWRMTNEPEVGTSTRSIPVEGLIRMIVEHPDRREAFLDEIASWPQADQDDAELSSIANEPAAVDLVPAPVPFARPPLPAQTFLDAEGQVIHYGSRWGDESPPEDAYSRETHPERFAPVLSVVDALIDHLETWYVVDVERRTDDVGTPVTHLRPSTGAPITLRSTDGGIVVEAGALFRQRMPGCTCDACDETAETVADRLEETVLAIAAGGLREVFPIGRQRWMHTRILNLDGGGGSSSGAPDPSLSSERLDAAAKDLGRLRDGWWPAWTLRPGRSAQIPR